MRYTRSTISWSTPLAVTTIRCPSPTQRSCRFRTISLTALPSGRPPAWIVTGASMSSPFAVKEGSSIEIAISATSPMRFRTSRSGTSSKASPLGSGRSKAASISDTAGIPASAGRSASAGTRSTRAAASNSRPSAARPPSRTATGTPPAAGRAASGSAKSSSSRVIRPATISTCCSRGSWPVNSTFTLETPGGTMNRPSLGPNSFPSSVTCAPGGTVFT